MYSFKGLFIACICLLASQNLLAQPWFQTRADGLGIETGFSGLMSSTTSEFIAVGASSPVVNPNRNALITFWDMCNQAPNHVLEIGTVFSNEYLYAVKEATNPDGYVAVGATDASGAGSDGFLVRTDVAGNVIRMEYVGDPNFSDNLYDVIQTSDGGYVMCGQTGASGHADAWVVKLDGAYNQVWSVIIGPGQGTDAAYGLIETHQNTILVTGFTQTLDINGGAGDIFVSEHELNTGAIVGSNVNVYGNAQSEIGWDLVEVGTEYYVTGYSNSNTIGGYDFFVLHLDGPLSPIGYYQFGGSFGDFARSIDYNPVTNMLSVAGVERSSSGGVHNDAFLATIDLFGNLDPFRTFHYGTTWADEVHSISIDPNTGDQFMVGTTQNLNVPNQSDLYLINADFNAETGCNELLWSINDSGQFPNWQQNVSVTTGPGNFQAFFPVNDVDMELLPYCITPCKKGNDRREVSPAGEEVTLAPNPATNRITLGYQGLASITNIVVTDIHGRELARFEVVEGQEATEIDLSNYEAGIYFGHVMLDNGNTIVKKFVRQ